MLLVKCWACGDEKERTHFAGRISSGRNKGGVPRGQCKPCRASYKRARNRARPVEALSKRSLTKMGMKEPDRVIRREDGEAASAARAAWREWMEQRAPVEWLARYCEVGGKPWNNPRLSGTERYNLRYKLDMAFRCAQRVRLRAKKKTRRDDVAMAIRDAAQGRRRTSAALSSLGYTAQQLKTHIERQFTKRMDWQAFAEGKIHIDHIRPLSAFDLSDGEQFREAFSLANMRPLWAKANMAKGARVEHLL